MTLSDTAFRAARQPYGNIATMYNEPDGPDLLWFEGPGGIHIEISSTAEPPPR